MKYRLILLVVLTFMALTFASFAETANSDSVLAEDFLVTINDFDGLINFYFSDYLGFDGQPMPIQITQSGNYFSYTERYIEYNDSPYGLGILVGIELISSNNRQYVYFTQRDVNSIQDLDQEYIDVSWIFYYGDYHMTIQPLEPPQPTIIDVEFYDASTLLYTLNIEKGTTLADSQIFLNEIQHISKPDHSFEGWFLYDNTPLIINQKLEASTKYYAKFEYIPPTIPTVTITYYVDGAYYSRQTIDKGQTVSPPEKPSKIGFEFINWQDEQGFEFDFKEQIDNNISLYANFTRIKVYISFYLDPENFIETIEYEYNELTTEYICQNIPNGFNLTHWTADTQTNTPYFFGAPITQSIALYAVFEPIKVYINYYVTESKLFTSIEYQYNDTTECISTIPTDPMFIGHDFKGWSTDKDSTIFFEFGDNITNSINLYAVFERIKLNVSYYSDGQLVKKVDYLYNDTITEYTLTQIPEGVDFKYWRLATDEEPYIFGAPITQSIALYAVFEPIKVYINYYVTQSKLFTSIEYRYNDTTECISTIPTDEMYSSYEFAGWSLTEHNQQPFNFGSAITHDIDLYAIFNLVIFTVEYYEGQTLLDWDWLVTSVIKNEYLQIPRHQERVGYTFMGWYSNDKYDLQFSFEMPLTKDVKLYCYYKLNKYDIKYQIDQEIDITAPSNAYYGDEVEYTFTFPKGRKVLENMVVSADSSIVATNEISFVMPAYDVTIIVTLSADMYTLILKSEYFDDIVVSYSQQIYPQINAPDDKVFIEWYIDDDLTQLYEGVVYGEEYEEIYLYPLFVPRYYELSVVGMIETPFSQIIEYSSWLNAFDINVTPLEGYQFIDFYIDEEYSQVFDKLLVLSDITLYAKCDIIKINVTFNYGSFYEHTYTEQVDYGQLPQFVDSQVYEYSEFVGWNNELEPIKTEQTYYAVYRAIYDNYYMAGDNLVVKTKGVSSLQPNIDYVLPSKQGHEFIGFSFSYNKGHENYYTAQFKPLMYNVIRDSDAGGKLVAQYKYEYSSEVSIFVNILSGYLLASINLDSSLSYTFNSGYLTFVMPAYDVKVVLRTQPIQQTEEPSIPDTTPTPMLESAVGQGSLVDKNKIMAVADLETVQGGTVLFGTSMKETQAQNVSMLLYNRGAEIQQTQALSIWLTNTHDGETKNLDFKAGMSLEILVKIDNYDSLEDGFFKVMMQSKGMIVFYDCKVVEKDGIHYVSFNADRTGDYIISYLSDVNKGTEEVSSIFIVSSVALSIVCIMLVIAVVFVLKRKKYRSSY